MHSRGVLHRDIQLGNCTLGLPPNEKTLFMIDFGFSKTYIDPYTNRHIPDSNKKRDFIGNYWFRLGSCFKPLRMSIDETFKVPSLYIARERVCLLLHTLNSTY